MGIRSPRTEGDTAGRSSFRSLTDALFSSTQRRVLGLLFGQPQRSFFATEIIGRVGAGSGAVQREMRKLADSGLVHVSWVGNQKHFQANPASPIFHELCSLIRKTVGLTEPLRHALEPLREHIELALVYGSVAKGKETAASDVDLMLVSDSLSLEEVYRVVATAEQALGRKVSPTLYTSEEFSRRRRDGNPFLDRVLGGETILLIGTLADEPD
jgi:predicted nucleotidyltransferase